jgi:NitT/TauT family transport system substrate-binding protein
MRRHAVPKGEFVRFIMVLILLLGILGSILSCSPKGDPGKRESITLGISLNESSALIYIADDQHFFAGNGLHVTLRDYDFGALALNGMLRGEADIAIAMEFPLVVKAFQKEKVCTIGTVGKFEFVYLIGRRDRGIEKISDLKGKKVANARQTIAEFYLGRYLNLHGMNYKQITFVDMQNSGQGVDAIVKGDVDAIVSQEPYVTLIGERLGANGVVWPVQSGQAMFSSLICREEWIKRHPELAKRLLNSLAQAEEYVLHHPVEAAAILQRRLNLIDSYAKTVWLRNQISLSLDQSLIVAMEDEARWMIKNNLTAARAVPDFAEYIYIDVLKAVKPEAVKIIR